MSLRFQADADLRFAIVKAVRERESGIDFASAAETGLDAVSDPHVLELAARENRILISHDRRTMLAHFRARLEDGMSSPGLLVVSQGAPISLTVNAIVLIWSASEPSDWRDQVHHLPSLNRHVFTK